MIGTSGSFPWGYHKCLLSIFWPASPFSTYLNAINLSIFHNHGGIYRFVRKVTLPCGQIYLNVYMFKKSNEIQIRIDFISVSISKSTLDNKLLCPCLWYRFNSTFQWLKTLSYLWMSFCHFVFKMGFFRTSSNNWLEAFLKISYYSQENTCVGVLKAKGL